MFNFFKKIKEKKAAEKLEEEQKLTALKDLFFAFVNMTIKDYVNEVLLPEAKEHLKTEIKEGDKIVINKYELVHQSANGWDMGSKCITMCLNEEDKKKVLKGTATEVRYTTFYLYEVIDRFVANLKYDPYLTKDELIKNLKYNLREASARFEIENYQCIYIDVFFDIPDISFKPVWGLNANSFLLAESEAGKKTIEAWEIENDINELSAKLKHVTSLMADKVKKITESHYNSIV